MNIKLLQLKIKKTAYIKACNLVRSMEDYSTNLTEETEKKLGLLAYSSSEKGIPLPSGRYGNAIALAFEINDYVSAKYLIENAEELGLETNTVVSDNPWGMKDEYLYSLLTFDQLTDEMIEDYRKILSNEMFDRLVANFSKQIKAASEVEKMLVITDEDKKYFQNR